MNVIRTAWEKKKGEETYYLSLSNDRVENGFTTSNAHESQGTSCTLEEFIAGRLNDAVRSDFGEKVLEEALRSAGVLLGNH